MPAVTVLCLVLCRGQAEAYTSYSNKKGIGKANGSTPEDLALAAARIEAVNGSWYYNWNIARNGLVDPAIEYVPMRHNRWWPNLDNLANIGEFGHLLTYNEPERSGQGNITVEQAIGQWPDLEAAAVQYDVLLSSPAPANPTHAWLTDFMSEAEALEYRVDFMAMHKYPTPQNTGSIINGAQYLHDTYGRDVWITEFNAADWNLTGGYTHEQSYTWMAELLYRLESTDYIRRYAVFPWDAALKNGSPRFPAGYASYFFEMDGTNQTANLTPLGRLYANYRSDDIYGPYTGSRYYLHNKSLRERLVDAAGTAATTNIYTEGDAVEIRLADAGNGNFYIVNRNSGTRLGSNGRYPWDGGTVYWTDANTGPDTQWTVNDGPYGWKFIDHAASGKRLFIDSSRQLGTGDAAWTGDEQKWAFIRANSTDAEADDDGDGMNNHAEFTAGTDASDPGAYFRLAAGSPSVSGMVLNWDSVTGRVYSVDRTEALTNGFTNLHDQLAYPAASYTDTVEQAGNEYFYRIRVRSFTGEPLPVPPGE
jgi:hypothetical protein